MKPRIYHNFTYHTEYHYFIGWSRSNFIKYMKKHIDDEFKLPDKWVGMFTDLYKGNKYRGAIIWSLRKSDYNTIAHECLHAANRTLNHIGWHPDLLNDEPQAYLMSELITDALRSK